MKYVVILGDGMADTPSDILNGKTPMECAEKPLMDFLAQNGEVGLVKTIPDGMSPGSDTANLSVMSYDPKIYYTGRSPLEAVSMGIDLDDNDVTFRCNLVTLSDEKEYENKTMMDYSSDEISTAESKILIEYLKENLIKKDITFFAGISYRHCMVYKNTHTNYKLIPPHDISDRKITDYLPSGNNSELFLELMKKSYDLLKDHPVNIRRKEKGLNPANSIWLWGMGKKPSLPPFYDKYKLKGAVISAVDLIKGIGKCADMMVIDVEGATGNINTNFSGKAQAAVNALKNDCDFVYIHIEAPDECGHRGEAENKVKSIELIDEKIIKPLIKELSQYDEFSILVLPDHPTPLKIKTHSREPVPYIIYRSNKKVKGVSSYTEKNAAQTDIFIEEGSKLLDRFILQ